MLDAQTRIDVGLAAAGLTVADLKSLLGLS
jgi:hypothetical protein